MTRIGVIGCGAIATRVHVPRLRAAGAQVTAFASRRVASAEQAATAAGSGVACGSVAELLDRPDVDAVAICTPNRWHAEQALAAIEAGKHVLVEKPFTTTVSDADAVIAAAGRRGTVVMVAHDARCTPPVATLQAAAERIGAVTAVQATLCHAGPAAWAPEAAWFRDPVSAGGGALLDLGVHLIDALRWILRDEFRAVAAVLSGAPVEDDALMLFETAAGAVGSLHAGWRAVAGPTVSVTLQGTQGSLQLSGSEVRLLQPGAEPELLPAVSPPPTPQESFVRAIADGSAGSPTAHDGRAAVAVVEAAYRSADAGCLQPVG